jgi:hypothetical protein
MVWLQKPSERYGSPVISDGISYAVGRCDQTGSRRKMSVVHEANPAVQHLFPKQRRLKLLCMITGGPGRVCAKAR